MTGGTFYLTTPIYYVNATAHLGHAYTTIVADAAARWHRLIGDRVWFLTGTDEHGDKIVQAAAATGVAPKEYVDRIAGAYRDAWRRLGITNDDFIRTTESRHQAIVQRLLQALWDAGEIYLGRYGGQYCYGCERFYTEKEIVDGKCPDHQTALTYIEEENYFFKMSQYQAWLIETIEQDPQLIRPERYRNEILGFLREPLLDLSISRPRTRLEWGIPLPFDDKYVTYVWFDALINYVSALGGPAAEDFQVFWPHAHHMIGKDILKPHAVYWPCMLKAAGLSVYRALRVHGYWTVNGQKMSKSVGNVVDPEAFATRYSNDAFRYFVMREMVFGLDADFSEEAFVGRLNADLANDLGNLASRASTLIVNFAGGVVPIAPAAPDAGELAAAFDKTLHDVRAAMEDFAFHRALASIWEFVGAVNRYVDTTQPWALAKQPAQRARLDGVLYELAQALHALGLVLTPFVPDAAAKIRTALGETGPPTLTRNPWGGLGPGARIEKIPGLFPRVEDRKPAPAAAAGAPTDGGPRITIDEFAKVDLRVAQVLAAEAVPKSKKLLKLRVSLGTEERTVLAGIAEHYAPADLVGKKVVVVANLQPAKLMGIESQGMVLAGSTEGGLGVLTLDKDLPPGAKVK